MPETAHPYPICPAPAASEVLPGAWLRRAQGGDADASRHLLGWAYQSASAYYVRKVRVETLLTRSDAEELAAMFVLEFERAWPRIRSVGRYSRRMLRNNLRRYLSRKRELEWREAAYPSADLDTLPSEGNRVGEPHPIERWGDDERHQLEAVREVLDRSDPITRELMTLRSGDPPLSYGVIAVRLGCTETALRMRATRFYRAVREAHARRVRAAT